MVGAAETAGGHAGADGRADLFTGADGPDKALVAGHHVGVGDQLLELRVDLISRLCLRVMQLLQRFLVGGILVHQLGGLVQLALQLVLLLTQLGLLGLHLRLLGLDVLPRLLQGGDNALVVLRHLVDELHAVQQVGHAGGLEQHRQIAQAAAFFLLTDLLAEQCVLLLLQQLIPGDLRRGVVDLVLGIVDLLQQQLVSLVQQILGGHHVVLLGLGLGDLLLQFLQLFLLLLLFLFQCGHLRRLALLLLQLSLGLGRISRSDGHGGGRTQQHQQCQHGAQNTFRFLHASAPFFTPGGTGVWRSGCRPHPPEYPCPGTPGPRTAIFS